MTTRTRQFHAPFGDTRLGAMNTFLRDVRKEQIRDINTFPRGRGTDVHILYEDTVPPRLVSSSPTDGAWVRLNYHPTDMVLLFNVPIDEARLTDSTFEWHLETGTSSVLASTVTVSEEGRRVDVPLPSGSLSGYAGPLTLVTEAIYSTTGSTPPDRIQVSLNITDGLLPRPGVSADLLLPEDGVLKMTRFLTRNKVGDLVDEFLRGNRMIREQIVQMSHVSRDQGVHEAFVLWYDASYPKLVTVTPTPNSTISSEAGIENLTLAFSEPISEYHLKGNDGVDRLLFDGTAFGSLPAGTLTQADDEGSVWRLFSTNLFVNEGVHTLVLRDIRNRYGEPHGIVKVYTWTVAPVVPAGGGGGVGGTACEREGFTGDGIETDFDLSYSPLVACDVNVYINGQWCDPTGWTLVGSQVRFNSPVFSGASVWVVYERGLEVGQGFDEDAFSGGFG